MSRLSLTIAVTTTLCGVYWLYGYWVRPLTHITTRPVERVEVPAVESPQNQPDAVLAQLRDHAWVQHPRMTFQQGEQAFLAFDSIEPIPGHGNRVRLTPCALVWRMPGEEASEPYTIVCDSARIEFANEFYESAMDLENQSPGRIVSGALEGAVEITGPDGLSIRGREFVFSEESESLYSDQPVKFTYGPLPGEHDRIEGSAEKIQVSLKPSHSAVLGEDMPRIAGVAWVQLRTDVWFQIDTQDEEHHPLTIDGSCAGSFTYYLDEQRAEFDDTVHIQRPTRIVNGLQQQDSIDCDRLLLQFFNQQSQPAVSNESLASWQQGGREGLATVHRPESPYAGEVASASTPAELHSLDFLELQSLEAYGSPVRMTSDEAGLITFARWVAYDSSQQALTLVGEEPQLVQAQIGDHRLWGRQVRLFHDAEYALVAADCRGAGGLQQVDLATGAPIFEATWTQSAGLGPDPNSELRLLSLGGRGRFVQPGKAEVAANEILLWLKPDAFDQLETERGRSMRTASGQNALPQANQSLPIVLAQARGDVVMRTPTANVYSQEVEAHFSETSLANVTPQEGGFAQGPVGTNGPQPVAGPAWDMHAERIVAHIQHDPVSKQTLVGSIEGTGGIRVDRAASPNPGARLSSAVEESAVHFTGRRFQLVDAGGVNQLLHMFGHPARFECGDMAIEGDDISLDRVGNLATIKGPGSLTFPVNQGLFGEALTSAELVDVQWRERMTFNGETAEFHTGVKVSLADSMVLCERIMATVNHRIDFTNPDPPSDELALSTIVCRDRMQLEVVDWQSPATGGNPVIQGIRKGDMAEFHANLVTGEFSALGPGEVHDWSRGESRRVTIAPSSVQANQPAGQEGELPWDYTHLKFTGTLNGNLHDQVGQLNDRVEITYAPVEHALSTFMRHDLSGRTASARDAVWLKCDRLQMRLADGEAERPFVQVAASGHAELEGQLFRAIADEVTYDEAQGMFSMRGLGHKAAIYYQEAIDAPYSDFTARSIEFIPRRNHLTLDGSPGIRGVQSSTGVSTP